MLELQHVLNSQPAPPREVLANPLHRKSRNSSLTLSQVSSVRSRLTFKVGGVSGGAFAALRLPSRIRCNSSEELGELFQQAYSRIADQKRFHSLNNRQQRCSTKKGVRKEGKNGQEI
jgi:hypothetical protein